LTTLLDRIEPDTTPADRGVDRSPSPGPATSGAPADRLRATMAACRVQFTWLGTQKSLTLEQCAAAAGAFDADGRALSAGKKLLDVAHPAFRAVTAVRGQVESYWRSLTLPYPEPGVRLIKQERVDEFARRMAGYRADLEHAVAALDRHYTELRAAARGRLGSLYNEADYPDTLVGLFGLAWDFPALEPPDYLVALSPAVYEQERARVAARFEEAVALAERAFADEFARLVEHLAERLSGADADGSPAVPRAQRPLQPRARRAGGAGAAGGPRRHAAEPPRRGRGARAGRGGIVPGPRVARFAPGRPAAAACPAPIDGGCMMDLVVDPAGRISCIYDEAIDLGALGSVSIARASHVEPDAAGRWVVDLAPAGGPALGPFALRSEALAAERAWLEAHWLPAR
jgi:hypothetical protein